MTDTGALRGLFFMHSLSLMTQQDDLARAAELMAFLDSVPADVVNSPEVEAAEDELDAITLRTIFKPKTP